MQSFILVFKNGIEKKGREKCNSNFFQKKKINDKSQSNHYLLFKIFKRFDFDCFQFFCFFVILFCLCILIFF